MKQDVKYYQIKLMKKIFLKQRLNHIKLNLMDLSI